MDTGYSVAQVLLTRIDQGGQQLLHCVVIDVTEQKQAQERLETGQRPGPQHLGTGQPLALPFVP